MSARNRLSPVWPVAPSRMLSMTVRRARALVSWNVRTIPRRAIRWDLTPPKASPLNVHVPVSGLSKPLIRLKKVVFPAPFGPMSAVIAPRCTSRCSTSTAFSPPNAREMLSHTRIASGLATPGSCSIPANGSLTVVSAFKRQLPSVTEDALWTIDHQQHEPQAHEHETDLTDLHAVHQPVRNVVGSHRLSQRRIRRGEQCPEDHRPNDRPDHRGRATKDQRSEDEERDRRRVE